MPISAEAAIEIREQHDRIVAIDSVALTETAKQIAFYTAMKKACEEDTEIDDLDRADFIALFTRSLDRLTYIYAEIVNQLL